MTQDERNLNLLSTFHYILAGLIVAFSCFALLCVAVYLVPHVIALHNELDAQSTAGTPRPTSEVDDVVKSDTRFMVLLPVTIALTQWPMAACLVAAGRKLRRRTSRTFCLVIAAVECAVTGPGAVLGILTIIVLMKDSVRELFAPRTPAVAASGFTPS